MRKNLFTLMFFVAVAGAPAKAQLSFVDRSARLDCLHAGANLWSARVKLGCTDILAHCVSNAEPASPVIGPLSRVDRRMFPTDQKSVFNPPLTFEANPALHGSVALLKSTTMVTLPTGAFPSATQQGPTYEPPNGGDRTRWVLKSSFGWRSLGAGVFDAAFETATNHPKEWHGTWEGFGKRFGTRQAGVTVSNTVEATLGAVWGEDPRYSRSGRQGIWPRTGYALKMSVLAQYRNGTRKPAYGRFVGVFGSNFVTNAWRPPSENDWEHALVRSGAGIASRMLSNLFTEFWR